jgi:aspartate kinase
MKFGGSSIKDPDAIKNVCTIIEKHIDRHPLIVLSALSGVTDMLIHAVQKAIRQEESESDDILQKIRIRHLNVIESLFSDKQAADRIKRIVEEEIERLKILLKAAITIRVRNGALSHAVMSVGELLSSQIITAYLNSLNITSRFIDSREIIIVERKKDEFLPLTDEIHNRVSKYIIPYETHESCIVCPGFIASTTEGEPATLGRDGSDYTASLLGAALEAEEIQIWSDVDGILSADPSIIPYARPLKTMTFDEACELAYFGARVLHPSTIQPALEKGILVRVLNSSFPDEPGTRILSGSLQQNGELVKSIAYKESITLLTVESSKLLLSPKIIEAIFFILTRHGKKVFAVSKSATKLSITIENIEDLDELVREIEEYGLVHVEQQKVIVSVVGERMKGHPSMPWQILQLLDREGVRIELVSQFASQISLTFIIDESDIERTVTLLHRTFIENNEYAR